ncbi:MAG: ABC transporter substrate-binding protein/permease [Candidatus Kapaibacterium sp.]
MLRWAADTESGAPYVFQDPRLPVNLIGFEVDIVKAIAEELGMETEFVQNQWDGLIPGLYRHDYDIAINGLEITEDRKLEVNFSVPYYITYEQLVVRKETEGIKTIADLEGRKVGTLKNSLAERILIDAGNIIVRSYESEANSFGDLENGRLDAVLIDAPVVLYYAAQNPKLKLTGQPIGEIPYGIALRKGDTTLLRDINRALSKLMTSGQLREILERWNLWNYMMALYMNDPGPSNTPPSKYNVYLEMQGRELSLLERLARYWSFAPLLAEAAWMTVKISVLSMVIAIIMGLFVALVRMYAPQPFAALAVGYTELIRGTPLLIQLYFIFFALPSVGVQLSPFVAAIIGLGLNYSAYEAEIYRAGMFSVPRGQMEAAISLGMNKYQALRHIILPQAIRLVLPPVTNDFISLLKDSSLVSMLTLVELTKLYGMLSSTYYDYVGIGIIIALIYLLLGLPFVRLSRRAEQKFSFGKRENIGYK